MTRLRRVSTNTLAVLVVATTALALIGGPSSAGLSAAQGTRRVSGARHEARHPRRGDAPTARLQTARAWVLPRRRFVPVGRLEIPAIDLATPFFMGVHTSVVNLGPGLWPSTPLPGGRGNAVLAGHRTTYTHPFLDLDLLDVGDVIRTSVDRGDTTRFVVTSVTIVEESDYVDIVLREPSRDSARRITLFACAPKSYRTHRIVVRAKVLPARARPATPSGAARGAGRS